MAPFFLCLTKVLTVVLSSGLTHSTRVVSQTFMLTTANAADTTCNAADKHIRPNPTDLLDATAAIYHQ